MSERSKYAYESAQESILRPIYRRLFWDALLRALPAWLSPNAMTAISTLCCAVSFLLVVCAGGSPVALLGSALLVFGYLTLDNLDGAQARRYGRSSRLGEFLDHWLDTLNNGFVVLGACLAIGLPPLHALAVLCVTNLAFFAVQWELRQTGVFRMGRLADVEGNTAVALLYVAVALLGGDAFRFRPVSGGPDLATALAVFVMAPAALTLFSAVLRVRKGRSELLPIAIAHGLLGLWAIGAQVDPFAYLSTAFFLNPIFTTRCIWGRLLARTTGSIDWLVVVGLACVTAWSASSDPASSHVAFDRLVPLSLAALTLWYFSTSIHGLRVDRVD